MDQRPIGIFDSGLGGLTAAKKLNEILPNENIVYFGDSRNAPYGVRSKEELAVLATANARFLQDQGCKAILVACGTVSSNVLDLLQCNFSLPFVGVIEAACEKACIMGGNRIAVIATEATIRSGAFEKKLTQKNPQLKVFSCACQSLVSLAEEGHFQLGDSMAEEAIKAELASVKQWKPDTLILACTHFPLFQGIIEEYLGKQVAMLSVGAEAAETMKEQLADNDMLAMRQQGNCRWFTSGDPEKFSTVGSRFLDKAIKAELHVN